MDLRQNVVAPLLALVTLIVLSVCSTNTSAAPLPSWNEGPSKQSIIQFVKSVSKKNSATFVPVAERIAVFDNDGTLWSEKPFYFQILFGFDQLRKIAPQHPEWKTQEPYASIITGDMEKVFATDTKILLQALVVAHANITTETFTENARNWLDTAQHPSKRQRYTDLVYQPMLELMAYLRANDFKVFIVSGGGIDFLRVFSEEVYGVPPEQVIGSSIKAKYEVVEGIPQIIKLPELDFIDDKAGKPVGVHQHIGRRPIFAAGNSDGDFQMLEWTTSGAGPRFGLLVHHTDAKREWAYDRKSHVGKLERGLDEAKDHGWTVVDMKIDWKTVYPKQ